MKTFTMFMVLTMTMIQTTLNPVKLSITILLTSMQMFAIMWSMTGSTWIPLVSMLMFSGGILVMFMILSSLDPNTQPKKMKNKMLLILPITLTTMSIILYPMLQESVTELDFTQNIKMFFMSPQSSTFATLMILAYFSTFIKILKKEKNCMRMNMC